VGLKPVAKIRRLKRVYQNNPGSYQKKPRSYHVAPQIFQKKPKKITKKPANLPKISKPSQKENNLLGVFWANGVGGRKWGFFWLKQGVF
jgi:hypothetical protein